MVLDIKKIKLGSIKDFINDPELIKSSYNSLTTLGVFSCTFDDLIKKRDMVKFSNVFGVPRTMTYLRKDEKYDVINIVEKKGHRDNVFGDVWHSDHAYEKNPPQFTIIHCPIIPPYGGETLFSSNAESFKLFCNKNNINLYGQVIVNKMPLETQQLLKKKFPKNNSFEVETTKNIVENIYGFDVFTCNRYHSKLPDKVNSTLTNKILNEIFEIQELNSVLKKADWSKNQILMWNNHLVLHKANNDYDDHHRTLWRILID